MGGQFATQVKSLVAKDEFYIFDIFTTHPPVGYLNPSAPKSDQFQISPAASLEILHHKV